MSSPSSPSDALDEPTFAAQIIREFRVSTSKRDFNAKREEKHNVAKRLKFEPKTSKEDTKDVVYDEDKAFMRAQLAALRAEKAKLETHVSHMEREIKRERNEKSELELKIKKSDKEHKDVVEDLQHRIDFFKREQDDRWSTESLDLKHEICHRRNLEKANSRLSEELDKVRDSRDKLKSQLEREQRDTKTMINDLRHKIKLKEHEIEKQKLLEERHQNSINELNTLRTKLNECESQLSKSSHLNQVLKEREQEGEENLRVHKVFQSQLDELPILRDRMNQLEKENKLLIGTMDRSEAMKEENEYLRDEVKKLEALAQEGSKFRHDNEHLKRSLKQWQDVCMKLLKDDDQENKAVYEEKREYSVEHLARKLGQWQRDHLTIRSELRIANDKLRSESARCSELQASINSFETSLKKAEKEGNEEKEMIKKMQRRITLLMKERDSYKSVLDSYENEVTFSGSQFQKDKIRSLETVLQQQTEFIDAHLKNAGVVIDQNFPSAETSSLKTKIKELEEERDRLRAEMSERAMRGDFDPLETKVVHMRSNPLSNAVEERGKRVEMLQAENDRLKTRLQLLEEGIKGGNTSVSSANKEISLLVDQKMKEMPSSAKLQELEERLRLADLRRDRLVEAFKKTSKEFRTACLHLLGYRIDGLANRQYRLTPVYSESEGDHLLFEMDSETNFTLLETPFSRSVRDLVALHLERQHSIPVFLAAIVIEQFSKQSFATNDTTLCSTHDTNTLVQEQSGEDEDPICID